MVGNKSIETAFNHPEVRFHTTNCQALRWQKMRRVLEQLNDHSERTVFCFKL